MRDIMRPVRSQYLQSRPSYQVPVTQKPYTVHVPQNVPVNFVPVSVPTQQLPGIQVVQQDPFTYCEYPDTLSVCC